MFVKRDRVKMIISVTSFSPTKKNLDWNKCMHAKIGLVTDSSSEEDKLDSHFALMLCFLAHILHLLMSSEHGMCTVRNNYWAEFTEFFLNLLSYLRLKDLFLESVYQCDVLRGCMVSNRKWFVCLQYFVDWGLSISPSWRRWGSWKLKRSRLWISLVLVKDTILVNCPHSNARFHVVKSYFQRWQIQSSIKLHCLQISCFFWRSIWYFAFKHSCGYRAGAMIKSLPVNVKMLVPNIYYVNVRSGVTTSGFMIGLPN